MLTVPVCGKTNPKQVRADIDKAKTYIKSGKDFDKAEKLMVALLEDSANHDNIRIYTTWYESVLGQYNAANEKLYLKQKYDTAAFYNLTRHLQEVAVELDALDVRPDKKGRVNQYLLWWNMECAERGLREGLYLLQRLSGGCPSALVRSLPLRAEGFTVAYSGLLGYVVRLQDAGCRTHVEIQ